MMMSQLESTYRFKYEVNNRHIKRESDITSDDYKVTNVELSNKLYENNELELKPKQEVDVKIEHTVVNVYDEKFTIKEELLDEQQHEADLQVPKLIFIINENESDEGNIDDDSDTCGDVLTCPIVYKDRKVCEAIQQDRKDLSATPLIYRSNGLPFNKELRVVLEDVMLTLRKQNTQNSANNDVSYLKFKGMNIVISKLIKNKETGTHPTINKGTLTNSNNSDIDDANAIEADKFIYPGLENSHDIPKNRNKKVCARTNTSSGNIDFTHFDAESSKHIYICKKSYHKKSILNQHMGDFDMSKFIYCSYIGHNKSNLNVHINTKHIKNTIHNCSYCSFKTCNKCNLSTHVNSKRTKYTIYNCSYCDYTTYRNCDLDRHVNAKHTKNVDFKCSYCSYKTYFKDSLKRHVNSKHSKNTVYNCSDCSFKTYDRSILRRHENSKHTENTIYNGAYCNYETSRNILNSHTKYTVYNCSYCSYKTYNKYKFSSHVNSKHSLPPTCAYK